MCLDWMGVLLWHKNKLKPDLKRNKQKNTPEKTRSITSQNNLIGGDGRAEEDIKTKEGKMNDRGERRRH